MLLKYVVSNYKSIAYPIEFSMFPTSDEIDKRLVKTIDTKLGKWKILRRGGFFGPNASGKTSFIESMYFAKHFIVDGQRRGVGTGIDQFRSDIADLEGKSTFQFMFYLSEEVYEYGFSVDTKQVFEEWLMVLTEKDFQPMFLRQTLEDGTTQIEIESRLARKNSKGRKVADVLKDSMGKKQKNQLFLYKLYDNGVKRAETIMEWFKNIQIIFPNTTVQGLPLKMDRDEDFREFISEGLKKMDTGVVDIVVVSKEMSFSDFIEKFDIPGEVIKKLEEIESGILSVGGKYFIFGEEGERRTVVVQIKFNHMLNGESVPFNIDDESDGTQRLVDLLPILFTLGKNNQNIFLIDEIDRSLHTKLSRHLLREFLKDCKDTCSQIVYTAHDVNLIDLKEFGQDEIWFMEKDDRGMSYLKPFSDFQINEGQDALKGYLNGRFGAIPVIRGKNVGDYFVK